MTHHPPPTTNDPPTHHLQSYEMDYSADSITATVGDHTVQVSMEFTDGAERCYDVHFTITDTDECDITADSALAADYPDWTHSCDESAVCKNTKGSYICECAVEGMLGALFSGSVADPSSSAYELAFGNCHG